MVRFIKQNMEENKTPETLEVGAEDTAKAEEAAVSPEAPIEAEVVEAIHEDAAGNVISPAEEGSDEGASIV